MTPTTRSLVPGTFNFRDLGGLPVEGGGSVVPGRLFRSDALQALGGDGRRAFADLGIRTVIDLRDDSEAETMPDHLGGMSIAIHRVPILSGSLQSFCDLPGVAELYSAMLTSSGHRIAAALRAISDAGPGGVLVHCTAGKDRTGVVIALALLVGGVDPEAVVDDYAATEQRLRGPWAEAMAARAASAGFDVTPRLRSLLVASPAAVMRDTIESLISSQGSIQAYLDASGLTITEQQRLRERLIS